MTGTTHKATETCSCGAKIDLDVWSAMELREQLNDWRANHRHDKAPAVAATTETPAADPGSVTTTASAPKSTERPPVFGFAPRRRL